MVTRSYIDGFEPSLEDLKRHLRITSDDLDDTLKMYLQAAIESAEHHIGVVIARSEFVYDGWFVRSFDMKCPGCELKSVLVDGEALSEADYKVSRNTLIISQDVTMCEKMTVTYEAGMTQVPFDIKAAILLMAAKLFNNPVDTVETLPSVAKNLLRPYRSWGRHGE
jgi:hypothetical protein